MTAKYGIAHVDEIPELTTSGETPIRPVRHHFGITAFGVNAWTGKDAGDRIINEHVEDEPTGQEELESTGQEELYLVLRGRAVFELDGERHEAREGTLVFVPPHVKRTAFAEEAGTTIVSVGGAPGQSYTPVGWELWYPLRKQYEAGEHDEVLARLRDIVAANPQYALLFYNLACLESLTGERAAAVEHLRTAVEMSEQFREYAKGDSDLDAIRDDPAFEKIVGR
jgi:mannose-6-phosphate isomerase-like protein (cupin superfamily)